MNLRAILSACSIEPNRRFRDMPGPGFEWIGKKEEKEVLEVLRDRWLFRYGDEKDPAF